MRIRSTTVIAVRRDGETALAADGQVSIEDTIFKSSAVKLRKMRDDQVLIGYAGAAADALALFERLEGQLDKYSGNLQRAVVELAKGTGRIQYHGQCRSARCHIHSLPTSDTLTPAGGED